MLQKTIGVAVLSLCVWSLGSQEAVAQQTIVTVPAAPVVSYVPQRTGLLGLRTTYRPVLNYPAVPVAVTPVASTVVTQMPVYQNVAPTTTSYLPATPTVTSFYAPRPAATRYSPPITTYAPPTTTTYFAPQPTVTVPTTTFYVPPTTVYRPAVILP